MVKPASPKAKEFPRSFPKPNGPEKLEKNRTNFSRTGFRCRSPIFDQWSENVASISEFKVIKCWNVLKLLCPTGSSGWLCTSESKVPGSKSVSSLATSFFPLKNDERCCFQVSLLQLYFEFLIWVVQIIKGCAQLEFGSSASNPVEKWSSGKSSRLLS